MQSWEDMFSVWFNRCTGHVGRINKDLLYSTEKYIQYSVINHNRKEYKKKYIYIYI